jgi:hypothetical protein
VVVQEWASNLNIGLENLSFWIVDISIMMQGKCKLRWFTFFVTLWIFCRMYSIQMPQTHYKNINLTKIFMD